MIIYFCLPKEQVYCKTHEAKADMFVATRSAAHMINKLEADRILTSMGDFYRAFKTDK